MSLTDRRIVHADSTASYWAAQPKYSDTIVASDSDNVLGCNQLTVVIGRTTPSGTREDIVEVNLHIAQVAGANLRRRLSSADMAAAETIMDTWWGSVKPYVDAQHTLKEYRWHERGADRPLVGPAVRVTTRSVVGTSAGGRMPDQIAATVSFITSSRKHWGRIYLPGLSSSAFDTTYGRIGTGTQGPIVIATRTAAQAMEALGVPLNLIVWSQQYRAALDIDVIQMDDVPDVQRRRRAKQKATQTTFP